MDKKKLFFIALIPHLSLREEIRLLKEEMKLNFNAQHALKSPAHVTLQMPFRKIEENESQMIIQLKNFAAKQNKFNIDLLDFGCFSPRVIFINIVDHKPIINLHKKFNNLLINQLEFNKKEINQIIYPHLTIATRDLSKEMFHKAWLNYKEKKFENSFKVNSIFLLKHNDKYWDIHKEFPFDD